MKKLKKLFAGLAVMVAGVACLAGCDQTKPSEPSIKDSTPSSVIPPSVSVEPSEEPSVIPPSVEEPSTSTEVPDEEKSFAITAEAFALEAKAPYCDGSKEIDNATFEWIELSNYDGLGIQMRTKNGKTSQVWNSTELPISKVELTISPEKNGFANEAAILIEFADNINFTDAESMQLDTVAGQTDAYSFTPTKDCKYVRLSHGGIKYSVYLSSITVYIK